jgi:hypothetical protein
VKTSIHLKKLFPWNVQIYLQTRTHLSQRKSQTAGLHLCLMKEKERYPVSVAVPHMHKALPTNGPVKKRVLPVEKVERTAMAEALSQTIKS